MPRLSLVAVLFSAAVVLSACQPAGGKVPTGAEGVTPSAVIGSQIEVAALDGPGGGGASAPETAVRPAARDTASLQAASTAAASEPGVEAVNATLGPAPKPALEKAPLPPKSDVQLACESKGSKWFKIGDGEKYACVKLTRDAAKRCDRESQCDGVCLARSGTCSPFKPLYGCNEILQDNGARVTLCLE